MCRGRPHRRRTATGGAWQDRRLKKLETELERIATHCHGSQVRDCYVIQALANHDLCEADHA
ncbi:hypothetical protein BC360_26040 [Ensifer sp. LC163]|nr:hypothetical protein BC360_26040 [Ensifer sp. LC163]